MPLSHSRVKEAGRVAEKFLTRFAALGEKRVVL